MAHQRSIHALLLRLHLSHTLKPIVTPPLVSGNYKLLVIDRPTKRVRLFFTSFHIWKKQSEAKMKLCCVCRKHCRRCNLFSLREPHLSKKKTTSKYRSPPPSRPSFFKIYLCVSFYGFDCQDFIVAAVLPDRVFGSEEVPNCSFTSLSALAFERLGAGGKRAFSLHLLLAVLQTH